MKIFIVLIGCIFIYGCANQTPTSDKEETSEPGVIDYMTGRQQIRTYKKIKSKLEEIDKSRQEQQEQYNDF